MFVQRYVSSTRSGRKRPIRIQSNRMRPSVLVALILEATSLGCSAEPQDQQASEDMPSEHMHAMAQQFDAMKKLMADMPIHSGESR